jgi:actin-like ATPase involved in cell morphogenesis
VADAWVLGIDVGTTWTAAAAFRRGRVEIVALGTNQSPSVPTIVFRQPGQPPIIGDPAARRSATDPGMVARDFKRRVGDPVPLTLGGVPVSADQLYADVLSWVLQTVATQVGSRPAAVGVTHPANWGPYKLDLLRNAARVADLPDPVFLSEPEAAAIHYAAEGRVADGETVAVYDLGGGTFDACVLRSTGGAFEVVGRPEGVERLGGIDFDEAVYDHVRAVAGPTVDEIDPNDEAALAALARLRADCTLAKEALSSDTSVSIPVLLPKLQTQVRLTRDELEARLREPLQLTIDSLSRAIRDAGLTPDQIGSVLLVGGSSRIPMVAGLVGQALGRPVAVDANPKHSIASGAALAAARAAGLVGDAEPTTVAAPVIPATATPAPPTAAVETVAPLAPPAEKGRDRRPLIAAAVVAVVAVIAAALLLGGGGDDPEDGVATDDTTATVGPETTTASTEDTGEVTADAEVVELDQRFAYIGYIFDFGEMTIEPPPDEFSFATVTITGTMENPGYFEPQVGDLRLEVGGTEYQSVIPLLSVEPGSSGPVELEYSFEPEVLEHLDTAVLRFGDAATNRPVFPVGSSSDVEPVLHPSVQTEVAISAQITGDRFVSGTVDVVLLELGASLGHGLPAAGDNLWFAAHYSTCVETLDSFLIPILVLPDGERQVAEGVEILEDGTATTGSPLTTTCPDEAIGIAYWQVPPEAAGQEVQVDLDISGNDDVAGSFEVTIPDAPDEASAPE